MQRALEGGGNRGPFHLYKCQAGSATTIFSISVMPPSPVVMVSQMLRPDRSRVLVLVNAGNVGNQARLRLIEAAAPSFGVQVSSAAIRSEADIEDAMNVAGAQSNMGLIVSPAPPIAGLRKVIFARAARFRLPAIYPFRYYVAEGGLILLRHKFRRMFR
jgi:ABC-type uncharacterized transport system substrate-binding protein